MKCFAGWLSNVCKRVLDSVVIINNIFYSTGGGAPKSLEELKKEGFYGKDNIDKLTTKPDAVPEPAIDESTSIKATAMPTTLNPNEMTSDASALSSPNYGSTGVSSIADSSNTSSSLPSATSASTSILTASTPAPTASTSASSVSTSAPSASTSAPRASTSSSNTSTNVNATTLNLTPASEAATTSVGQSTISSNALLSTAHTTTTTVYYSPSITPGSASPNGSLPPPAIGVGSCSELSTIPASKSSPPPQSSLFSDSTTFIKSDLTPKGFPLAVGRSAVQDSSKNNCPTDEKTPGWTNGESSTETTGEEGGSGGGADENGGRTDENGDRTDENGDRTDENGDRTDENGDRTDENGGGTDGSNGTTGVAGNGTDGSWGTDSASNGTIGGAAGGGGLNGTRGGTVNGTDSGSGGTSSGSGNTTGTEGTSKSVTTTPAPKGWSIWLPWTSCRKLCGYGTRRRYKICYSKKSDREVGDVWTSLILYWILLHALFSLE